MRLAPGVWRGRTAIFDSTRCKARRIAVSLTGSTQYGNNRKLLFNRMPMVGMTKSGRNAKAYSACDSGRQTSGVLTDGSVIDCSAANPMSPEYLKACMRRQRAMDARQTISARCRRKNG